MKKYDTEYIERKVKEYEKRTGLTLDPHNKGTLRQIFKDREDYAANEEREHSNSVVGDHFNQQTYN